MKKIFIAIVSLAVMASCNDLTELNKDPKRTDKVPAYSLFASAQKTMMDNLASPSVNTNIFRLLSQQWTETTYVDESNYDLTTRSIPQTWWHSFYRDVIKDLHEAKTVQAADDDPFLTEVTRKNRIAIAEILEVYAWTLLVDTFGDVPYSEALQVSGTDSDNLLPKYDDAATIYSDLINRLNAAIGNLDAGGESWGSNDLLYGGDVAAWIKLANSIKLRMGMTLADVNPSVAQTMVSQAIAGGVLESNDDNAIFYYKAAPPNTNPIWVNLIQSNRKDFVAANTLVDSMNALNDPRRATYFTLDADGGYTGGEYGSSNNYATYSKVGDQIDNADFPGDFFDYSEVEFFLAEAAVRGFIADDPAEHYTNAIQASLDFWGVKEADAAAYLANPDVAWATAVGDSDLEKIAYQKWIALYNRGFEAWTEWRRLDTPTLVAPPDALSDVPLRYTYPTSEQNLNTNNYNDAVSKIGDDDVAGKIFWDVN